MRPVQSARPRAYLPSERRARRSNIVFWIALVVLSFGVFTAILLAPSFGEASEAAAQQRLGGESVDSEQAYFALCSGPVRTTCVVDGDTIWYRGEKIRLVGFDTPEITYADCQRERELGEAAKQRLRAWLNDGAFSLTPNPEGRTHDHYGRALLVLSRGGENVGGVLVGEGLAERRGGGGNVWCSS